MSSAVLSNMTEAYQAELLGPQQEYEFGGRKDLTAPEYVEACKAATPKHTAHIDPDGKIVGPEGAPVFVGNPYINPLKAEYAKQGDDADMVNDRHKTRLTLIYRDMQGRTASKCAVFIRIKY